MNHSFEKPKRFGEILDLTFQITKRHFSSLFVILLLFMGPVFLVQALSQVIGGRAFFRNVSSGGNWIDQLINTYDQPVITTTVAEDIGTFIVVLLSILFYPVAYAAVILLVRKVKDGEEYTTKELIKQAFTRFWPLFWSTLLVTIMIIAIIFFPLMLVILIGVTAAFASPILSIVLLILLVIGGIIGFGLLFTRWSFYLPATLFQRVAPGLTASWQLTKGRTWKVFLIYVVLILITLVFNFGIDLFATLLGTSVLYGIIMNMVTLITTIITTVGYAVVYFDAINRNTAGDLKGMIDAYQGQD